MIKNFNVVDGILVRALRMDIQEMFDNLHFKDFLADLTLTVCNKRGILDQLKDIKKMS